MDGEISAYVVLTVWSFMYFCRALPFLDVWFRCLMPIVFYCFLLFYIPLPRYCKMQFVLMQLATCYFTHIICLFDWYSLHNSLLINEKLPFLITDDVKVPTNWPECLLDPTIYSYSLSSSGGYASRLWA